MENSDISRLLKKRKKFDHKGIYGHGLLVAGSWGKMGSVTLGAGAALRTGIGLLTCQIPVSGRVIIQTAVHEAMVRTDRSENYISEVKNTEQFDAIGIGPGLGTMPETQKALFTLLSNFEKPMVIDADALNILSLNSAWNTLLKPGSILTPHPKEFERLAGKTQNSYERLEKQIGFSRDFKCIVVLKGAHTSITTPEGNVIFNSTGNPGMATAGSGDVLTGIILSLLAQGYSSEESAMIGVYLHGLAGDIAAEDSCYESILASDIINNIGKAFNRIRE
jgi:NAD(P)H-hydrate epimerase